MVGLKEASVMDERLSQELSGNHISSEVGEQLTKLGWTFIPGFKTLHLISPGTSKQRGVELTFARKPWPETVVIANAIVHTELPPALSKGPYVRTRPSGSWDEGKQCLLISSSEGKITINSTGTEVKPL